MKKLLIVGQTPPPYHGQAIIIQEILNIEHKDLKVYHTNLQFSVNINELSRFSVKKLLKIPVVIGDIWLKIIRYRPDTMYYCPPGDISKVPFYRDILILSVTRVFFKKVIFHFHASGLAKLYHRLNIVEKFLFKLIYSNPEVSIVMTQNVSEDSELIKSKVTSIIPYGIRDIFTENFQNEKKIINSVQKILFVGAVRSSKGVDVLVEAGKILLNKGLAFEINIIGDFISSEYQAEMLLKIQSYKLEKNVFFRGVKSGLDKFDYYFNSDVFCFPTYYESESFPVVLLEALQFKLPIVSTQWRGINEMIKDDDFLCPIKSAEAIAEKLELLLRDSSLRITMGNKSRELYEKHYTVETFKTLIVDTILAA